jgi:hypothetical protein
MTAVAEMLVADEANAGSESNDDDDVLPDLVVQDSIDNYSG